MTIPFQTRGARRSHAAFSMVEVALALGIVAFVLLSVLALLPLGMKSNQISAEETRAVCILSAMDADLRHTHPLAASGKSRIFGFELPYAAGGDGRRIFNPGLTAATTTLGPGFTTGLDESETAGPVADGQRYQASVIYTSVPADGSPSPLQARLVVNWPARTGLDVADLTDPGKTSGFVEALVSFPPP